MGAALGALLALFVGTFLLGSIPWGLVISELVYKKDIRQEGSGNIGTTNAMRSLGKVGGAAVFVLDFGKGLLSGGSALLVGGWLASVSPETGESFVVPLLCGLGFDKMDAVTMGPLLAPGVALAVGFAGCTWGHIFSPWLKFKGGKGIAVAVGALFFVYGPVGACLELAVFIVLVLATRYVSVGSVAAAAVCPFFALWFFWGNWFAVVLCSLVALTVVWAHRANIARLRAGTENRIGSKKKSAA